MGYTVDIDTGGTFTDGFVTNGERSERVKVDTTPHDLTVCFLKCIEEGSKAVGFDDVRAFLKQVDAVRYSTTVGTNSILQRNGAKLGLLVTKGFEHDVYGNSDAIYDFLVDRNMVVSVAEKIGADGEVQQALDDEDALSCVKRLLDSGARIIVVSLFRSHLNAVHEKRIKAFIALQYPKHYLGSVPVILASQFTNRPDELTRTNLALLNGYVHKDMARYLYKAEDDLRALGYRKPLLAVHASGGVARVAKTRAADTVGSGPVAGYIGSLYWAKKYGLKNVVMVDVGGTSIDIGTITGGEFAYSKQSHTFGIPMNLPLIDILSYAGGGGTIAKVDRDKRQLALGPESAGARPGPACYDLGGSQPTVTDAGVALGHIDPLFYLGGRRTLNGEKAKVAVRDGVAKPLGLSTEQAALQIVDSLHEIGARDMRQLIELTGANPSSFVMFAYGGAGPTHCCGMAEKAGIPTVIGFPFSPVFCAFGSSTMDVLHIYERYAGLTIEQNGTAKLDLARLNTLVQEMQSVAFRDLRGEGFPPDSVGFSLELEFGSAEGAPVPVRVAKALCDNEADVGAIVGGYRAECERQGVRPMLKPQIQVVKLRATCPLTTHEARKNGSALAVGAVAKARRPVYWSDGWVDTPVYDLEAFRSGGKCTGEAIIESRDTTYVLPRGWTAQVDEYQNIVLELR